VTGRSDIEKHVYFVDTMTLGVLGIDLFTGSRAHDVGRRGDMLEGGEFHTSGTSEDVAGKLRIKGRMSGD